MLSRAGENIESCSPGIGCRLSGCDHPAGRTAVGSGAAATGVINCATPGGSVAGVGSGSARLCVMPTVVETGGPPPTQPLNCGGGKVNTRSMVSSLGTPGPATVAPPSCSVTGTHLCQVHISLGTLSGVNQSHFMSVQAGRGAIPDVAQIAALTIPGGTLNLSGSAGSSPMS